MEVLVVDRHSTDRSGDILASRPEVKVLQEPPESRLVAGYATGADHASHRLLFFCNEDLYLAEGCLRRLACHIDPDRRVGAADPWQWTYDGGSWIHCGVRFTPATWNFASSARTTYTGSDRTSPIHTAMSSGSSCETGSAAEADAAFSIRACAFCCNPKP